jgi:hypothetical protein
MESFLQDFQKFFKFYRTQNSHQRSGQLQGLNRYRKCGKTSTSRVGLDLGVWDANTPLMQNTGWTDHSRLKSWSNVEGDKSNTSKYKLVQAHICTCKYICKARHEE